MKIDTSNVLGMPPDWFNASYLLAGTPYQQDVFALLSFAEVFEILEEYSPCLAGTIPLQVDILGSDADIICEVKNHKVFREYITEKFGQYAAFSVQQSPVQGLPTTLAAFVLSSETSSSLTVEIFGQSLPVQNQNAYRHLVVEARLLGLASEDAKTSIRMLKNQGIKTEPAFAEYFGIVGEPYQALLDLYDASDESLYKIIQNSQGKC